MFLGNTLPDVVEVSKRLEITNDMFLTDYIETKKKVYSLGSLCIYVRFYVKPI